jgi:hypothetical protein
VSADIPTLNQNTTGTASNVTGTVAIANGGTGQTTKSSAYNALTPITATGDLVIGNGTNSATRLPIGTNGYVLTSNGTTASWSAASSASSISWQSVQTANFTAVSGNGYPVNTASGAITVTLPASPSAGNIISLVDYAGTSGTNNITISPNGNKIQSSTSSAVISVNRQTVNLVYIDATQGWLSYAQQYAGMAIPFTTNFLVIAGGGGSSGAINTPSGGGGAGGFRTSAGTSGGGSSAESALTLITGTAYTVTVGAGGAGVANGTATNNGNNSVFATITSTGGGGGSNADGVAGKSGGSGGGGQYGGAGGAGTTSQGYAGGTASTGTNQGSGAGGGAGGVGGAGTGSTGGTGGVGVSSSISGSSVSYAGGGGGSTYNGGTPGTATSGGGAGARGSKGANGTANTGGGAGGTGDSAGTGASGGSGIVIIKVPDTVTATFSAGVTYSGGTASGGFKVYSVTATSTTSETVTFN